MHHLSSACLTLCSVHVVDLWLLPGSLIGLLLLPLAASSGDGTRLCLCVLQAIDRSK